MTTETIGFGVVAVGGIGSLHARNIALRVPGARVLAVTDVDRSRAERVATDCSAVVCDSYAELLDRQDVHAVVVASPSPLHGSMTIAALQAGKHVLCEKPLTCTVEEADRVVAAAQASGTVSLVGFQRRYDRDWRRAAALVHDGHVGQPRLYVATYREREPLDGDSLRNVLIHGNIHDLDAARWVMGEIEELSVIGQSVDGSPVGSGAPVENLITTLRFASGALGVIDNGTNAQYGFECRAEIVGSEATLRVGDSETPAVVELRGGSMTTAYPADSAERFGGAYVDLVADMCSAVRGGRPTGASVQDGRASLVLALAAERALVSGLPVRLAHKRVAGGVEYEIED